MRIIEVITEDISRRGFLRGLGAAAGVGAAGLGYNALRDKNPEQPAVQEPQQEPEQPAYKIRSNETHANSEAFKQKLLQIAQTLGVQARDLWKVMHFETKGTMNPAITNSIGATGLIQFMPDTAKGLGTSTDKLRQMTATDQLDYVLRYYKSQRLPAGSTASDIYLSTLFPAALRQNLPDTHVLAANPRAKDRNVAKMAGERIVKSSRITRGRMWAQNPVFRQKGRDYYTVGDVRRVLDSRDTSIIQ